MRWSINRRRIPRLVLLALTALVALAGLGIAGSGPAAAGRGDAGQPAQPGQPAQAEDEPGRVVIISLPTLRWADVVEHQPAAILDVLERSAVASTSVRAIGPHTDAGEAYASIGAGNRAAAPLDVSGLAYEPSFPLEWGTAGEVYERRTDQTVDGSSVVHLGIAWIQRSAEALRYDAEPGALGDALAENGLSTAVVANADLPPGEHHREAALAVMDSEGRVAGGAVSADLLSPDPAAAFGTQLDPRATSREAQRALEDHEVVLVEASDLARVDGYWLWMTEDAAVEARRRAIAAADQLVADLVSTLDLDRDVLMLIGPTPPSNRSNAQLTVFSLAGPGIEPGFARSGTTRRAGYITLPDVAPTILDHYDIDQPEAMNGTPITSAGGGAPTRSDLEGMVDANEVAVFRDRAVGPVSVVYIVVQVAFYALAIAALVRGATSRWRTIVLGGILWVLAIPPLVFLSGLVRYDALTIAGYVVVLMLAAAALAALAWWAFHRHLLGPPLALVGLTLVVLLIDVMTGGTLQINTVFGYSPTVAGRFAGFGNLAFALVGICAVTTATALWATPRLARQTAASSGEAPPVSSSDESSTGELPTDDRPGRDPSERRMGWAWWAAAAILVVTSFVVGYPSWGSDVGGVMASIPAFGIVLLLLAGSRLEWRRLLVLGVATVAVLGVFAALDLSRPEAERTHLGRFVESTGSGGAFTIINRKLGANVDILTSTVWAWLVPAGLVFLLLLLRRDRGMLSALQRQVPGFRAFLIGALAVGILGMAVNDSGVAVPAMMFGVALPYLTYVVIRTDKGTMLPAMAVAGGTVAEPDADGDAATTNGDSAGGKAEGPGSAEVDPAPQPEDAPATERTAPGAS